MTDAPLTQTREIASRHKRWVANNIAGKVREFGYNLKNLVASCDLSLADFNSEKPHSEENSRIVIYSFSGLANCIQTLKDSSAIIHGTPLPWSDIAELRHGSFFRDARNAATHDGHPIINAWSDGRYHVATTIVRLDHRDKLISIEPPKDDVRTLCLQFSEDFCEKLRIVLASKIGAEEFSGSVFSIDDLDEAMAATTKLPDFVTALYKEKRAEIAESLPLVHHDPLEGAEKELSEVIAYCKAAA